MLVDGRRAIVAPDGSVREERTLTAEPLHRLLEVPTAAGPRLVGVSGHQLHRFVDPLGAPTTLVTFSNEGVSRAAPGPSYVAIWRHDGDEVVDVETGERKTPPWPLTDGSMGFRSMTEGYVSSSLSGLQVTTDGGATFRHVELPDNVSVEVRDGALLARKGNRRAVIDPGRAAVDPFVERPRNVDAPALVRWIERNGTDPREVAVHVGLPLGPGEALAAQQGLMARVDLASGAITELVEYPFDPEPLRPNGVDNKSDDPCHAARAGKKVWLGCRGSGELIGQTGKAPQKVSVQRGFGVHVLDVEGDRLNLGKLVATAPRDAELDYPAEIIGSPAGGALLTCRCHPEERGDVCVLQPDGSWKTLAAAIKGDEQAVVPTGMMSSFIPLADGGMAYVLVASDEHRMALVNPAGGRRLLPAMPPPPELRRGDDFIVHAMQQRSDGAIQVLLRKDLYPVIHWFTAVQPLEGAAEAPRMIRPRAEIRAGDSDANALGVALGSGRIVAAQEEKGVVLLSTDAGEHWMDLRVVEKLNREGLTVSDVGIYLGSFFILGDGLPAPYERPPLPKPPEREPAPAPELALECTVGGGMPVPATELPREPEENGAGKSRGVTQGVDLPWDEVFHSTVGRVELTVERTASWTFRWLDRSELGARVHTFRGKPPDGAPADVELRVATASGDHAYVVVIGNAKPKLAFLGHITPRAARWSRVPEVNAVSPPGQWQAADGEVFLDRRVGLSPPAPAGAPLAWLADGRMWLWADGEEPRAVAQYDRSFWATNPDKRFLVRSSDKAEVRMGWDAPESEGVRLWSTAVATGPAASPLPWLPVTGWTHHARAGLAGIAACTDPGRGVFVQRGSRGPYEIPLGDGSVVKFSGALFRLRIDGAAACIESCRCEDGSTPGVRARLQIDFVRRKGELVLAPDEGKPSARAVTCTLGPAPAKH